MRDRWDAFASQTNVSRETLDRLETYVALLRRWNAKINLVSKQSLDDVWDRHILDSAQLWALVSPSAKNAIDLGSGGGFPGAILAIMGAHTGFEMTLVESDQRKCAFLRSVARETGADFKVKTARIEQLADADADVVTARALAPLPALLEYSHGLLATGGRCLFLKGETADREIEDALETWTFDCKRYPSKTDEKAVILSIGDIERV